MWPRTSSARMSGTNSTIFPLYARPCSRAPSIYSFIPLFSLYSGLVPVVPSFRETSETSETIVPIKSYTRVRAWYTSLYFSIPSILRARFTRFSFHPGNESNKGNKALNNTYTRVRAWYISLYLSILSILKARCPCCLVATYPQ